MGRRRPRRQEPLHASGKLCICQRSSIRELPWATRMTRGQATRPGHNAAVHWDPRCPHSLLHATTSGSMADVRAELAHREGRDRSRQPIPRQHIEN